MNSKGRTFSDQHIQKMRGLLENYLQAEFRNMYLQNISRRMIDDYLIDIKSKKSGYSRPLAAYTKNILITVAKNIFQEALDLGLVKDDPTYSLVKFRDIEKKEREIFTIDELKTIFPEEIDRLKQIWHSFEWASYFFIMGSCGLRPGEVSALTWGDWHRKLHGLIISHSIENSSGRRKCTKTDIKNLPF